MPLPNNKHITLLSIQRQLGYDIDMNGLCNGLANMAIQAHLCGSEEFDKFSKRLNFIYTHPTFFSNEMGESAYKKIVNEITAKRHAARNEITREFISQNQTLPKYIPVNVELTAAEQNALEVAEFFEGIAIFQRPDKYKDIMDKSMISQSHVVETSKQIQSQKLENEGGLYEAASYVGLYDFARAAQYMKVLDEKAKQITCNFGILLSSSDHTICLLYESKAQHWILVDANTLPPKTFDPNNLDENIITSFPNFLTYLIGIKRIIIGFGSTIFASGQDKTEIQKFTAALDSSEEFKELHAVESYRSWTDTNGNSLISYAARHNSLAILLYAVKSKENYINNLLAGNPEDSPLKLAIQFGHYKCVEILVAAKTLHGKPRINLNAKAIPSGETVSYIAVNLQLSKILQILIDARNEDGTFRADLDLATTRGETPISAASEKKYHYILKMLAAAKCDDGTPRVNLNARIRGKSLLEYAFLNSDLKSFKILEEHGANSEFQFEIVGDPKFEVFLDALKIRKKLISHIDGLSFKINSKHWENECSKLKNIILKTFKKQHSRFITDPEFIKKMEKRITKLQLYSIRPQQGSWLNSWVGSLFSKANQDTIINTTNKSRSKRIR